VEGVILFKSRDLKQLAAAKQLYKTLEATKRHLNQTGFSIDKGLRKSWPCEERTRRKKQHEDDP
jgi:hypothetical protein